MRLLTLMAGMLVPLPAFCADPIQPPANIFAAEPATQGALWWRQIRLDASPPPQVTPALRGTIATFLSHRNRSFGIWQGFDETDECCEYLLLTYPYFLDDDQFPPANKKRDVTESMCLLISGEWKYTRLFDGWLHKWTAQPVDKMYPYIRRIY